MLYVDNLQSQLKTILTRVYHVELYLSNNTIIIKMYIITILQNAVYQTIK